MNTLQKTIGLIGAIGMLSGCGLEDRGRVENKLDTFRMAVVEEANKLLEAANIPLHSHDVCVVTITAMNAIVACNGAEIFHERYPGTRGSLVQVSDVLVESNKLDATRGCLYIEIENQEESLEHGPDCEKIMETIPLPKGGKRIQV